MKRISILATITALVFLTGCKKDVTVQPDNPSGYQDEIAIRTIAGITKSAINSTSFPEGYDIMLSAYKNVGSHKGEDASANYFEGIRFTKTGTTWKSTSGPKYYPIGGTLDFLAVASAGYKSSSSGIVPTITWGKGGNVSKRAVLAVPDNSSKFDDLMYAYSNDSPSSTSGTAMSFKHSMAAIVFLTKSNVAYNSTKNVGITINSITIKNAKFSGTLTLENPSAGKGTGNFSATWSSLGNQKAGVAARIWNTNNTGTNTSESSLSAFNVPTSYNSLNSKPFGDGYILVPAQTATSFSVNYTVHNGYDLNGTRKVDRTYEETITAEGTWDIGKKHIYQLNFTLTGIEFNPVIIDWDDNNSTTTLPPPYDPIKDAANGHEWVDLGLRLNGNKILIATCNIGANNPEDFGDYFAWGQQEKAYSNINNNEVIGGSFDWSSCPWHTGSSNASGWLKYIPSGKTSYWGGPGSPDNKLVLDEEDDIAHIMWGGQWRMPTKEELQLLINESYVSLYFDSGTSCLKITGKGEYTDSYIFLPAAGYCGFSDLRHAGDYGSYWSRSLLTDNPCGAWCLCFEDGDFGTDYFNRFYGYSVRPVLVIPDE